MNVSLATTVSGAIELNMIGLELLFEMRTDFDDDDDDVVVVIVVRRFLVSARVNTKTVNVVPSRTPVILTIIYT